MSDSDKRLVKVMMPPGVLAVADKMLGDDKHDATMRGDTAPDRSEFVCRLVNAEWRRRGGRP